MKHVRKRLTYANVMSSIAVFLVLGGATAFAATKIGANEIKANSIKTGKIVKEAVTTSKIKNSAVNGAKLANDSVGSSKIADGSIAEADLANEAVGNAKIKNNAVNGAKLADGSVSAAKLVAGTLSPACPSGTTSVGGVCIESSPRPAAPYVSAIETCSGAGRLLPQASELIAFTKKSALPAPELSASLFATTTAFLVNPDGTLTTTAFTTAQPFRCVAQPTP